MKELNKLSDASLGKALKIGDETFESLDEIISSYKAPPPPSDALLADSGSYIEPLVHHLFELRKYARFADVDLPQGCKS